MVVLHPVYTAEEIMGHCLWCFNVHGHGTFKLRDRASDDTIRMGDYSESMTARELLDIVEFLKTRR